MKNTPKDAFSLFPDLMKNIFTSGQKLEVADYGGLSSSGTTPLEKDEPARRIQVQPPKPPDLGFLKRGLEESGEQPADVPTALVLFSDDTARETASASLRELGYQIESGATADETIELLESGGCATLIMAADFEGGGPGQSRIHRYMSQLPMARRRAVFYVLVGDFQTLYNLEALALSANLVVNRADMKYMRPILTKGYRDYEELFGPLLSTLGANVIGVGAGRLT
ncbi:MAG: hypothetical protein ABFR63_06210 [Thermodesulfobacteriota bacterium]